MRVVWSRQIEKKSQLKIRLTLQQCVALMKICMNIIELKTNDVEEFGGANRGNGASGLPHVGRARLA